MPAENYGLKIFSAEQLKCLDLRTQELQQIGMSDLIERAAEAFTLRFTALYSLKKCVYVFCGIGNNGRDGLAISARLEGYEVVVYVLHLPEITYSPDFIQHLERVQKKVQFRYLTSPEDIPDIGKEAVVIDALLGTGTNRPAGQLLTALIEAMNASGAEIVSVDIASGLFISEQSPSSAIVQPQLTLTFELPKLCFFLPKNQPFVGRFEVLPLGLDQTFIANEPASYSYLQKEQIGKLIQPRAKFSHKGTFGHVLLFAGSKGKMGAALLCAQAALRTGCGLLSLLTEESQLSVVQTSIWEAMCLPFSPGSLMPPVPEQVHFTVGIGPGIGKSDQAFFFLECLLKRAGAPMVLDADALNVLSENPSLWASVPPESILTPHPKEFERMAGSWNNDYERLELQKRFSASHQVIVVLKGAHTSVSTPDGNVYFNSSGNPGMATGGSGDVLTGMITSLLAQHYSPVEAAVLGVYLHGLAGDIAARYKGEYSLIASDIVAHISDAFLELKSF